MNKIIVAGTGRSGTGYMAKLLTANGIRCGHESVFTQWGPKPWRSYRADSSWLAVPHLRDWKDEALIVHHVRDAASVLRSWFFDWPSIFNVEGRHKNNRYAQYLYQYYPDILDGEKPQDRALLYYIMCNRLCEEYSDCFFRVEDDPTELLKDLGVKDNFKCDLNRKVNTRDKKRHTREDAMEVAKTSRFYSEFAEMYEGYYPGVLQELQ